MQKLGKIAGINLLVILGYTLFSALLQDDYIGMMMGAILLHIATLFVLAIVFFFLKESGTGGAYLLTALLVLVVGFSACAGGVELLNINFLH